MRNLTAAFLALGTFSAALADELTKETRQTPGGLSYEYSHIEKKRDGWKLSMAAPSVWNTQGNNPWASVIGGYLLLASGYGDVSSADKQAAFEDFKSNTNIGQFPDSLHVDIYVNKKEIDEYFSLVLANFNDARLDPELFENIKGDFLSSIKDAQGQSNYKLSVIASYALFHDTSYALGNYYQDVQKLEALTLENCQEWLDAALATGGWKYAIAGADEPETLEPYLDEFNTQMQTNSEITPEPLVLNRTGKTILLLQDDLDKANIFMEAPIDVESQDDLVAIDFIHYVLNGSTPSGRLWSIREELRASYGFGSGLDVLTPSQFGQFISGESDVESQGEVLEKIREIHANMQNTPITEDEFESALKGLIDFNKEATKDENFLASVLASEQLYPNLLDYVKSVNNLSTLSYEEVSNNVMGLYPKDSDWTTIIVSPSNEGIDADCEINGLDELERCFE